MDSQSLIYTVAGAIRKYLDERPESTDTLEGIHFWWINWDGYVPSVQITEQALEFLEAQAVMEKISTGNRLLWRRRREID